MSRLQEQYERIIRPFLIEKHFYSNPMELPKIKSIHLHQMDREILSDIKQLSNSVFLMELIAGQRPIINYSKKSVSSFKLRKGVPIGSTLILRSNMMYDFLDKTLHIFLPRVKEFQGLSVTSFDQSGNYSFGVKGTLLFLEVETNYDFFGKVSGLDVNIVFTKNRNRLSEKEDLLKYLQFPFTK
jgi:large subunit ribosomal protein L5